MVSNNAAAPWTRVDQIGSLVRPAALVNAFAQADRGELSASALAEAQDQAIRDIIARQEAIQFPVLVDGEFRRHGFQDSFGDAVSGYDVTTAFGEDAGRSVAQPGLAGRHDINFNAAGRPVSTRRPAEARLQLARNIILEEYRACAPLTSQPVRVALIGPDRVAQRFRWESSLQVYRGLADFTDDVVAIQREMIRQLAEAGCPYLQIDAPGYTAYVDEPSMARMRARGEDPEENFARSISADNALIEGFSGITFGIHICKGNQRTIDPVTGKVIPQWHREGTYDAIAERLFSELNHERFLLEYDDERSGDFAPLRFIPKGRIAVLGLVSTKRSDVETVDELKRRIDDATRYLPLEQLAISPQCGFASGIGGVTVTEDQQWRKLEVLVETARQVWG